MTTTNHVSTVDTPRAGDTAVLDDADDGAVVILRWDKETGWAWLAHGRGATSRFAGFMRLADPAALPTTIDELGWELLNSREVGRGLVETEIRVPLTGVRR